MRAALIWTVNLVLVVNGGAMLVFPETWFGLIPSLADTGPFNPHFVRDVGSAYLIAGSGLIWFSLDKRARPAAVAAAASWRCTPSSISGTRWPGARGSSTSSRTYRW